MNEIWMTRIVDLTSEQEKDITTGFVLICEKCDEKSGIVCSTSDTFMPMNWTRITIRKGEIITTTFRCPDCGVT
jgi:hypothetical protein